MAKQSRMAHKPSINPEIALNIDRMIDGTVPYLKALREYCQQHGLFLNITTTSEGYIDILIDKTVQSRTVK